MREIKFRGWDEESSQMLPSQDLTQVVQYWTWLGEKDVKLLQFTGLIDKNGTEIYEGDVLRYDDELATFIVEATEYGWFPFGETMLSNERPWRYPSKNAEVIDNIYERNHLLKKEH